MMGVLADALGDGDSAAVTNEDSASAVDAGNGPEDISAGAAQASTAVAGANSTGDVTTAQAVSAAPPATIAAAQNLDEDGLPDNHPVPRKALLEERRKRQQEREQRQQEAAEFQRQIAELQGRLSAFSQSAPQAQKQQPQAEQDAGFDYVNPDKWVQNRINAVNSELSQQMRKQKYEMSEMMVRSQHADFDEARDAFARAMQVSPWLKQAFEDSNHPAKFIYDQGKSLIEASKYGGSIDEMRKKMKEEARAELEAERANAEAEAKKQASLTAAAQANTSTAGARGTGASTRAAPRMRDNPLKDALA